MADRPFEVLFDTTEHTEDMETLLENGGLEIKEDQFNDPERIRDLVDVGLVEEVDSEEPTYRINPDNRAIQELEVAHLKLHRHLHSLNNL